MSIPLAIQTSEYSHEIALCSCGRVLTRHDFLTDWLGRTVERCPSCGPKLLLLRRDVALPNGNKAVRNHFAIKERIVLPICHCGKAIKWCGRGAKPIRCYLCRQDARRKCARERWYRVRV
jgi:hypothetical protein